MADVDDVFRFSYNPLLIRKLFLDGGEITFYEALKLVLKTADYNLKSATFAGRVNDPLIQVTIIIFVHCLQVIIDENQRTLTFLDNGSGVSREDLHSFFQDFVKPKSYPIKLNFFTIFNFANKVQVISGAEDDKFVATLDISGEFSFESYSEEKANCGNKVIIYFGPENDHLLNPDKIVENLKMIKDSVKYPLKLVSSTTKAVLFDFNQFVFSGNFDDSAQLFKTLSGLDDPPYSTKRFCTNDPVKIQGVLFCTTTPCKYIERVGLKVFAGRTLCDDEIFWNIESNCPYIYGVAEVEVEAQDLGDSSYLPSEYKSKMKKFLKGVLCEWCDELSRTEDANSPIWAVLNPLILQNLPKETAGKYVRYYSSKSGDTTTTLDEYISRMVDGQDEIYMMASESLEIIRNSPMVERYIKDGVEVLFSTDTHTRKMCIMGEKYKGFTFVQCNDFAQEVFLIPEQRCRYRGKDSDFWTLCQAMTEKLDKYDIRVRVSRRLVKTPCCFTDLIDSRFESPIMLYHDFICTGPELGINPFHEIFILLKDLYTNHAACPLSSIASLLCNIAVIDNSYTLPAPNQFLNMVNQLVAVSLNVCPAN